jgi:hypothetical protein
MKECRIHREAMSAHVDGAAAPAEAAALEAHLATCEACRRAFEELRWTMRQVKGLEPVEPPPWMTAKIMARLRAEEPPRLSIWRRVFFPIVASAQFRVASLVLVGAAGYYIVSKSGGVHREIPEARPVQEAAKGAPARADDGRLQDRQDPTRETPREKSAFAPPPPAMARPEALAEPPAPKMKKDAAPPAAPAPALGPDRGELKEEAPRPRLQPAPAAKSAAPVVAAQDLAAAGETLAGTEGGVFSAAGAARKAESAPSRPAPSAPSAAGATGALRSRDTAALDKAAPAPSSTAPLVVRIEPSEPATFQERLDEELRRAGAEVIGKSEKGGARSLTARLDSSRLPGLIDRLSRAGTVREKPESLDGAPSVITITIRW